jgi:hypothetical protein
MGYYLPWAVFGGIITSIGNGLIATFTASTSIAAWIGFQVIVGAGRGSGMQIVRLHVTCRSAKTLLTHLGYSSSPERRLALPISNRLSESNILPKSWDSHQYRRCQYDL